MTSLILGSSLLFRTVVRKAFASLLMSFVLTCVQAADLLVSSSENCIRRFDGTTGTFLGYFVTPGAGGLNGPGYFIFGPDGKLYVSSNTDGSVKRYNGTTGAYIDDFVPAGSGGISDPDGLAFGPDGNLYVAIGAHAPGGGKVARYNGTTGAYINDFVPSGSGGLAYPNGLVFGRDGSLYVADGIAEAILRYNGATGAFMDVFVPIGTGDPTSLTFGPDGNLYVSLFYGHAIKRYNGSSGADMGVFVPAGSGGLSWDWQIAFGPDGNLYETERYGGSVKRYSGTTGAYIGNFAVGIAGEVLGLQWFPPPSPLYSVCLLYDSTKAVKSGSTIPIKLQLCDGGGNNLSSSSITLHAISITQASTSTSGVVVDSGNANPDSDFRYDSTLNGTGGYIFNLSTKGLSTGTYMLNFTVTGDSFVYGTPFQVK